VRVVLASERDQTVRDALSRLPGRWKRLLEMLWQIHGYYAEITTHSGSVEHPVPPEGDDGPVRVLLQTSERNSVLCRIKTVRDSSDDDGSPAPAIDTSNSAVVLKSIRTS